MINRTRVRLLVDALRSGEYEQCTGTLTLTENGKTAHCCLGVATEVALANGLTEVDRRYEDNNAKTFYAYRPDGDIGETYEYMHLPDPVRRWYGFNNENPVLTTGELDAAGEPERAEATELNDERHWNFSEIADAFERTFLRPEVTK